MIESKENLKNNNFKLNVRYKFEWCKVNKKEKFIHLFNEDVDTFDNSNDFSAMINVEFYVDDLGVIHLSGDELIWKYEDNVTFIDRLDEPPLNGYIKHDNGFKLFGVTLSEPYDYVRGWYALKKTRKVEYALMWDNYTLKFSE